MRGLNITILLALLCSLAIISLASGLNELKKNNLRGVNVKNNKDSLKNINTDGRMLQVRYISDYCEISLILCNAHKNILLS